VQIGDALAEAIEKLDCGEEKKEEISQKLESVKKELKIIQAELPTDSIMSFFPFQKIFGIHTTLLWLCLSLYK